MKLRRRIKNLTHGTKRAIVRRYKHGYRVSAIAAEFDVEKETVAQVLLQYGIIPRGRRW